jgi:Protein of unknown function (DUF4240)
MDEQAFWDMIDRARASAKPFHQALIDDLAARGEQEILGYSDRFDAAAEALNRWDVWAAAYLIGRGRRFMEFRAGVVAQGRDWYSRVLTSPDSLADHPAVAGTAGRPWDDPLFYEQASYAAPDAYQRAAGDEEAFYEAVADRDRDRPPPDMGEQFDFDDQDEIRRRLPRLYAVCVANGEHI